MATWHQLTIPVFKVNLSCSEKKYSQYFVIIGYHIIDLFVTEHIWRKRAFYACLLRVIAQILNGDVLFLLFYIIINKMKYQITENEENLFFFFFFFFFFLVVVGGGGVESPRCK